MYHAQSLKYNILVQMSNIIIILTTHARAKEGLLLERPEIFPPQIFPRNFTQFPRPIFETDEDG